MFDAPRRRGGTTWVEEQLDTVAVEGMPLQVHDADCTEYSVE